METEKYRKSELKFIYWFAHYNLVSPSVRYRGKYALDFLREHSLIESYFIYPSYKPLRILFFVRAYFSALFFKKPGSIIVVQRLNSNFIYANLLKLLVKVRKRNSVYDIDDADYLEYPPDTIYYFSKNCSKISVGSNELLKNLSKYNHNIILNTSSTPDLHIVKNKKNELFTIGWIGGFGGDHKLSLTTSFFPCLKNLPFKVKLVLLGVADKSEYEFLVNYFKEFRNVVLEMPQTINWNDEADIQKRISNFDVGIATLVDNEMQRSKSAFKAKQYMNNGVPVLSVDIPENNLFVEHGKNGFICSSPEDFKQRIIEVNAMNTIQYQYLSDHARASIPKFSLETYCDKINKLYFEL
ncbi:MAG: glycosyl transferase group 1 [Bacteroidetes bacterium]|jgi:glycosyltransferase involved in cell wall biosynthesis|nr:glycosyl transferase group 1 [Bacteroidota bacterium]MDF2452391.1 glycosyl transferase group 1 [Bacteroidota bacterium]